MRAMKDSGIEWFGTIPNDWNIVKVKRLFSIGRGRVIATPELQDNGYPVYSSQTKNNGILGYLDTYDFECSQLTWTTDGANAGTVFLREGKHNCTNVCGTLMPIDSKNDLRYLLYILSHTAFYHKRADINGYKIMNNEMAEIEILLPPLFEEQRAISAYLDRQCALIDSVTEKTKASIEEYKKLRQAVITQAVTKGVRGDRPMKDSGIEWIGEIPAEWDVVRLKFILSEIVDCPHETPNYTFDGDYYVIRTADEDYGFLRSNDNMYRLNDDEYQNRIRRLSLDKDDIVYGREGERWGLACLVPDSNKYCLGQRMMQFRCKTDTVYPLYLKWALNSWSVYIQGCFDTLGSTSPHVNISTIINYYIPMPCYEEQIKLAEYMESKSTAINALITKKETFLAELEAYKKSLIYEYVTGKKEVPQP